MHIPPHHINADEISISGEKEGVQLMERSIRAIYENKVGDMEGEWGGRKVGRKEGRMERRKEGKMEGRNEGKKERRMEVRIGEGWMIRGKEGVEEMTEKEHREEMEEAYVGRENYKGVSSR